MIGSWEDAGQEGVVGGIVSTLTGEIGVTGYTGNCWRSTIE